MHKFSKDHVIILPHAEAYRDVFTVTLDEIVLTLNEADLHEGLTNDKYTVEKTIGKKHIYIYYYQTSPLQGKQDELYAIVDFVSVTEVDKK